MCIFHKWGKWEQYTQIVLERRISMRYVLSSTKEYRQRKQCAKCGKVKDELINEVILD